MSWIILVAGSILGGVLSAYSRRDRSNVLLRLISSLVPFGFTAGFFYMQYKSGGLQSITKTLQITSQSGDSIAANIITLVITSVICIAISKGLGVVIVNYLDEKR